MIPGCACTPALHMYLSADRFWGVAIAAPHFLSAFEHCSQQRIFPRMKVSKRNWNCASVGYGLVIRHMSLTRPQKGTSLLVLGFCCLSDSRITMCSNLSRKQCSLKNGKVCQDPASMDPCLLICPPLLGSEIVSRHRPWHGCHCVPSKQRWWIGWKNMAQF